MSALIELAQRTLRDGSMTEITLFWRQGTDECIVEATNINGTTSMVVAPGDAVTAFNHPFSREEWLDYPTAEGNRTRPLTDAEYALAEALNETEVEA